MDLQTCFLANRPLLMLLDSLVNFGLAVYTHFLICSIISQTSSFMVQFASGKMKYHKKKFFFQVGEINELKLEQFYMIAFFVLITEYSPSHRCKDIQ